MLSCFSFLLEILQAAADLLKHTVITKHFKVTSEVQIQG